jgi:hypothetical protein
MAAIRYCVVYGIKFAENRFLPIGEFYLRGTNLDEAKELFTKLPHVPEGGFVFRLYERYYDKHTEVDVNYRKSEFAIETDERGFHTLLDTLIDMQKQALDKK